MLIEVICSNKEDVVIANKSIVDRIELIENFNEGGLTPNHKLVEECLSISKKPIYVMVRPHSKSFVYDKKDFKTIKKDIKSFRKMGVPGIVFGSLNNENNINEKQLEKVIKLKGDMKLTFHRAFDKAKDYNIALDTLLKYDVDNLLTSGQSKTALEGIETIGELVTKTKNHKLTIMAGSGVTLENITAFKRIVNIEAVHLGSSLRVNNSIEKNLDPLKMLSLKR